MIDITDPQAAGFSPERLARIRPAMQKYVDDFAFAGISTLIARRGRVVHFDQVGWQDRESQTPLAPDTIFRLYSMTKPIICTAFMTLFEAGRVRLHDPLANFLPAFAAVRVLSADGAKAENLVRPITIRDLLTHTSGLTYGFLVDSPVCDLYRQNPTLVDPARSLADGIADLARQPLAYQPGTRWHYSVGIDVIAHLIELIADQPLPDFLAERLFQPLGMTDTGFCVPPAERARVAAMYGHPDIANHTLTEVYIAWKMGQNGRRDVEATNPMDAPPNYGRGGNGLFSTVGDFLRYAQMVLNGGELDGARILAPRTIQLMYQNHLAPELLPYDIGGLYQPGYGFGLGSRVLLNPAAAGTLGSAGEHGWGGAAKTNFWIDPREAVIGIFMTQFMLGFDQPDFDFKTFCYQALMQPNQ